MARIRTIKPEFWGDEKVAALPRLVRLTFLGIISAMSDDAGRCRGNPRLVRAAVYPMDDDVTVGEITKHLKALEAAKLIGLYTVANEQYIHIINWSKHQKINRPSDSHIPEPPAEHSVNTHGTFNESSVSPPSVVEGRGEESSGEERNGVEDSGSGEPPPRKQPKYPHFPMADSARLSKLCVAHGFGVDPGVLRKTLAPFYPPSGPIYPIEQLEAAMLAFVEARDSQGTKERGFFTIQKFFREAGYWVRIGSMPRQDPETGAPTERGLLLMGAA